MFPSRLRKYGNVRFRPVFTSCLRSLVYLFIISRKKGQFTAGQVCYVTNFLQSWFSRAGLVNAITWKKLALPGQLFIHFFGTLKCLHDRQGHRSAQFTLSAFQGHPPRRAIFCASKRLSQGHPSRSAISVDLKPAKMVAPYKRIEYYRTVYLSKASAVEEDHNKLSDD